MTRLDVVAFLAIVGVIGFYSFLFMIEKTELPWQASLPIAALVGSIVANFVVGRAMKNRRARR